MESRHENLHKGANGKLFEFAKQLRRQATEAEVTLWKELRNGKLDGLKFRRQHPLGNFIADFYCHEKKLVIEVDGSIHKIDAVADRDLERTNQIAEVGISVIRFENWEVMNDMESVLKRIRQVADKK